MTDRKILRNPNINEIIIVLQKTSVSNVKTFFLEVEHEGISGLKTQNFTYFNPNSTHTDRHLV
jgi:hypothetical protein